MKVNKNFFIIFSLAGVALFVIIRMVYPHTHTAATIIPEVILHSIYCQVFSLCIPYILLQFIGYLDKRLSWQPANIKRRIVVEVGLSSLISVGIAFILALIAYQFFSKPNILSFQEIGLILVMNMLLIAFLEAFQLFVHWQQANQQLTVKNKKAQKSRHTGEKKTPKYETSSLTSEAIQPLLDGLLKYMEQEKPYLNPDLNYEHFLEKLDISRHHFSQILNDNLQQNFFDFINAYRINEAKQMLQQHPKMTVLEILYAVGFNSKSSFNTAFKKATQLTPTQYRKQVLS